LEAAHQKGLHIVLDYVPNHTSDEHPWFLESRSSRQNPKRDWYIWHDPRPNGNPPNNWESFFGGSAWTWDSHTQQYYLHLFLEKQPDLNWSNPEVVSAMHNVLRFWLDKGVDGFRMDVATSMMKHPDFPDNPTAVNRDHNIQSNQSHIYDINQPEVHVKLREIRQVIDSYPGERVIIGETWVQNPEELMAYYGKNLDELHLPFNFTTIRQPWVARIMQNAIKKYYKALPKGATPNFVFGNHDINRLATRFGYQNHRSVGLLLLTLRGTPTMYYGDEIGMRDVDIPSEYLQDPVALRNPETTDGRDPERTPMQWDDGPNAGFCDSEVKPWLPIANEYLQTNVSSQERDPISTLNFYKQLLHLRKQHKGLLFGELTFLEDIPEDIIVYRRNQADEKLLIAINFSDQKQTLHLNGMAKQGVRLLSTHMTPVIDIIMDEIILSPNEGQLILLK
jgi:alpha-glucosidase